jgi:hypothetical protein
LPGLVQGYPTSPSKRFPDLRAPALTDDDVGTGRRGFGWPKRLDGWPMMQSKQRLGVPLLP